MANSDFKRMLAAAADAALKDDQPAQPLSASGRNGGHSAFRSLRGVAAGAVLVAAARYAAKRGPGPISLMKHLPTPELPDFSELTERARDLIDDWFAEDEADDFEDEEYEEPEAEEDEEPEAEEYEEPEDEDEDYEEPEAEEEEEPEADADLDDEELDEDEEPEEEDEELEEDEDYEDVEPSERIDPPARPPRPPKRKKAKTG
jgi:hypothetical protein